MYRYLKNVYDLFVVTDSFWGCGRNENLKVFFSVVVKHAINQLERSGG